MFEKPWIAVDAISCVGSFRNLLIHEQEKSKAKKHDYRACCDRIAMADGELRVEQPIGGGGAGIKESAVARLGPAPSDNIVIRPAWAIAHLGIRVRIMVWSCLFVIGGILASLSAPWAFTSSTNRPTEWFELSDTRLDTHKLGFIIRVLCGWTMMCTCPALILFRELNELNGPGLYILMYLAALLLFVLGWAFAAMLEAGYLDAFGTIGSLSLAWGWYLYMFTATQMLLCLVFTTDWVAMQLLCRQYRTLKCCCIGSSTYGPLGPTEEETIMAETFAMEGEKQPDLTPVQLDRDLMSPLSASTAVAVAAAVGSNLVGTESGNGSSSSHASSTLTSNVPKLSSPPSTQRNRLRRESDTNSTMCTIDDRLFTEKGEGRTGRRKRSSSSSTAGDSDNVSDPSAAAADAISKIVNDTIESPPLTPPASSSTSAIAIPTAGLAVSPAPSVPAAPSVAVVVVSHDDDEELHDSPYPSPSHSRQQRSINSVL